MISPTNPAVSLRALQLSDVADLTAISVRNRADIERVSPADVDAFTEAAMRLRVERLLGECERGERRYWTIRVEGTAAGDIGISHIQRGALQRANLGYMVDSAFRGRGVATAAARLAAAIAFGEMGLHRLEAGTMLDNVGSQRVLENAGFTRVGVQRAFLLIDGRWQDHYLYELVAPGGGPTGA